VGNGGERRETVRNGEVALKNGQVTVSNGQERSGNGEEWRGNGEERWTAEKDQDGHGMVTATITVA